MSENKPTYYELLKHPKWQEKRLRVMERAGFKCEECGDAETTLNVHHGYYRKGADPWDYEDDTLHCLCEPCHEKAESVRLDLYRQIAALSQDGVRNLLKLLNSQSENPRDALSVEEAAVFEAILASPDIARDAIALLSVSPPLSSAGKRILAAYHVACESTSGPVRYQDVKPLLDKWMLHPFGILYQNSVFKRREYSRDPVRKINDALDKMILSQGGSL